MTEALLASITQTVRPYQRVTRLGAIAWQAHRARRRVPDPDLGVWPLFWLTPVLDQRGVAVERLG